MPRQPGWRAANLELARQKERDYYARNREAACARSRRWRLTHTDVTAANNRKWNLAKYGLGLHHYSQLAQFQANKCAICQVLVGEMKNKRHKYLYVDHCHKSNLVRGLLCANCNFAVSRMETVVGWHEKALAYLADPPAKSVFTPEQSELIAVPRVVSIEERKRLSDYNRTRKVTWGEKLAAPLRKLNREQVDEIQRRLSSGEASVAECTKAFGVSERVIRKVRAGKYFEPWPWNKKAS